MATISDYKGKKWSKNQEKTLMNYVYEKKTDKELVFLMGRNIEDIKSRIYEIINKWAGNDILSTMDQLMKRTNMTEDELNDILFKNNKNIKQESNELLEMMIELSVES